MGISSPVTVHVSFDTDITPWESGLHVSLFTGGRVTHCGFIWKGESLQATQM